MISPIYVGKAGNVCHKFRENPGFALRRPSGLPNATFWHFLTPVTIQTPEGLVDIKPGGCYFCPQDIPQYIYSEGTLYHDWMHLSPRAVALWEKLGLDVNRVYYMEDSTFITGTIRRIEEEHLSGGKYSSEMIDALVTQLFIGIYRACHREETTPELSGFQGFRELRRNIRRQPHLPWTVEEMAKSVSLSTSRFHAVYKAMFGSTPVKDLIGAKVEQAKAILLMDREATMISVAEKLGYKNQYHFIRQFKTVTGITPGAYRKENE